MKKLLILCAALVAAQIMAAPGEPQKTNTVTFVWDCPGDDAKVDKWHLYWRTSVPPGMPLTNNAVEWTPPDSQRTNNTWAKFMDIPNDPKVLRVTITNTWSATGSAAFFVLTASNEIGESPFSNVAWMPRPIDPTRLMFKIESVK